MRKIILGAGCAVSLTALALLPCSCGQSSEQDEVLTDACDEITASMGDATGLRTTLYWNDSVYSNVWSEGDAFRLTDGTVLSTYSNEGKSDLSRFARTEGERPADPDGRTVYYYYYPAGGCGAYDGDGTFSVSLPEVQKYNADGTVTVGAYPMMGCSRTRSFSFYNLASVLVVRLRSYPEASVVRSVTVSAADNLSGDATAEIDTADFRHPVLRMAETAGTPAPAVLDCGDGVAVGEDYSDFFVVVPPGTHSGLTVSVETAEGIRKATYSSPVTFARSSYVTAKINLSLLSGGKTGTVGEDAE